MPERARGTTLGRLEAIVRANRVTIAVVFPLVGAATLLASAEGWLPELLAFNALLLLVGTAVMRTPLLVGAAPLVRGRVAVAVVALVGFTYVIEFVGVTTGHPYGAFSYRVALGPMIGGVPAALPLFFLPLVANAYLLAVLIAPHRTHHRLVRLPLALAFVLAIDLVLDPAAVALGFWAFDDGGWYYGVPASNFGGWILSGTVALVAIDLTVSRAAIRRRVERCEFILDDLVSFVLLWGLVNLYFANLVPVVLTGGLVVCLVATGRYAPEVIPERLRAVGRTARE